MVLTIICPVAYINVDTVAGLLDGDGKRMALATDKSKFLFQVEVTPVNGYGEQVVG